MMTEHFQYMRLPKRICLPQGFLIICLCLTEKILRVSYRNSFGNGDAVDPLTVILSISEEEKSDPRVSMAIDEMLEEHVW